MLFELVSGPVGEFVQVCNPQNIRCIPSAPFTGIEFLKIYGTSSGTGCAAKAADGKAQLTVSSAVFCGQTGRGYDNQLSLQRFLLATLTAMFFSKYFNGDVALCTEGNSFFLLFLYPLQKLLQDLKVVFACNGQGICLFAH